ncbi:hypothetical protein FC48_GL001797 [Ligilactobacillus murinus DSM 20452 = NBRC 14221]|uniref:Uncharacterized protein n=1 Tax=Ligilactobacillus murinus DSM 20452 = NBRC 14221 TaxID=1423772 RepID=A0A0R2ASC3_9LACO|nr:hypothetical protein FC48_GL001797 [Ligilactobacillus murinus DSM 20452 = NBRC 14221]
MSCTSHFLQVHSWKARTSLLANTQSAWTCVSLSTMKCAKKRFNALRKAALATGVPYSF